MGDYFLTNLVDDVHTATGGRYSKEAIENIFRLGFDRLGDVVAVEGRKAYVIDFFNFFPKDFKAKNSVNPQTGKPMVIEPYRTIYLKPTSKVKKKLAKGVGRGF